MTNSYSLIYNQLRYSAMDMFPFVNALYP